MSPDSLFSLSGFQKSLLISVYQIRRRISAAPRPTLTKGIPLFPAIPFVPRPACFLHLRRVSFLFASHSRILARQALPLTKGIPLFPPPPSYRVQQAPATTKGQLPSRLPPFVSLPGRLCLLRRVSSVSPPHPSYRVQLASYTYEGLASFSRPTIRIRARQGFQMPRQKEKAGHFARPLLKDYILCSNLHSKFCFTPTAPVSAQ